MSPVPRPHRQSFSEAISCYEPEHAELDTRVGPHPSDALVSSLFTVCLIEPVRVVSQRRLRRRELRRSLYQEMANNCGKLQAQVEMAKNDSDMRSGIGGRFAMGFKKFSFELAQRDPACCSLGYSELYWIELLYRDMEHIISGTIRDRRATFLSPPKHPLHHRPRPAMQPSFFQFHFHFF
jgi:hypothetical protein